MGPRLGLKAVVSITLVVVVGVITNMAQYYYNMANFFLQNLHKHIEIDYTQVFLLITSPTCKSRSL